MKSDSLPPLFSWLIEPLPPDISAAIGRLRRAPDVQHIAVMPDVHLASDVCVGCVVGTSRLIYPQAAGGDIGCGMLAVAFDVSAEAVTDAAIAGRILRAIDRAVPPLRRHRRQTLPLPDDLSEMPLRHPDSTLQFGTLGSGNHFIELQADEQNTLWLMIHSGSRAMGQAIREHHMSRAEPVGSNLKALDAETETGRAYVRDVAWARHYADANRRAMAALVAEVLGEVVAARILWDTVIAVDHNHVALENGLWVHRKGAMPAHEGAGGLLPGSMGSASFHVEGRGCASSLCSSAHGAGRALSRQAAKRAVAERDVHRQMQGIWYDYRMAENLREEAQSAYKDIRAVIRAQRDLTKVTRVLRPVLNYKGR